MENSGNRRRPGVYLLAQRACHEIKAAWEREAARNDWMNTNRQASAVIMPDMMALQRTLMASQLRGLRCCIPRCRQNERKTYLWGIYYMVQKL
jgi:hypothetical protein